MNDPEKLTEEEIAKQLNEINHNSQNMRKEIRKITDDLRLLEEQGDTKKINNKNNVLMRVLVENKHALRSIDKRLFQIESHLELIVHNYVSLSNNSSASESDDVETRKS